MYDRSISAASERVLRRRVRQIPWSVRVSPPDWPSAHRSASIAARVAAARERHIALMYDRGGRWGR